MEKQLYIKIEQYKNTMNTLDQIKHKIDNAKQKIHELRELRAEEKKFLDAWDSDTTKVHEQIIEIEKALHSEKK
ncbi:MAG: hypothetical protein ACMXX6_00510 [Candidatus Woesearchaeota archaeon]